MCTRLCCLISNRNKPRLHCSVCLIPSPWLYLFVPHKDNRSSFEKAEVRAERSVSDPLQGQADCHPLKAASQYKTLPSMSDMCWQIITWGFIKRQASGLEGITMSHLTCTQPKCQICGWKAHQGRHAFVHTFFPSVHPNTPIRVLCISAQLQRRVRRLRWELGLGQG